MPLVTITRRVIRPHSPHPATLAALERIKAREAIPARFNLVDSMQRVGGRVQVRESFEVQSVGPWEVL